MVIWWTLIQPPAHHCSHRLYLFLTPWQLYRGGTHSQVGVDGWIWRVPGWRLQRSCLGPATMVGSSPHQRHHIYSQYIVGIKGSDRYFGLPPSSESGSSGGTWSRDTISSSQPAVQRSVPGFMTSTFSIIRRKQLRRTETARHIPWHSACSRHVQGKPEAMCAGVMTDLFGVSTCERYGWGKVTAAVGGCYAGTLKSAYRILTCWLLPLGLDALFHLNIISCKESVVKGSADEKYKCSGQASCKKLTISRSSKSTMVLNLRPL